jgi:hypothetical protein
MATVNFVNFASGAAHRQRWLAHDADALLARVCRRCRGGASRRDSRRLRMTLVALVFAAAALLAEPPPAAPPASAGEEAEIVVRAVRGKCRIELDRRNLSDREFSARAGEWASLGTPVRVIAPRGADYECLAKIAFKLNDKGVRLIHFVDRNPSELQGE